MVLAMNVANSLQLLVCGSRKVLITTVNHHDNQQMWAEYDPAEPTFDLAAPRPSVLLYTEQIYEELIILCLFLNTGELYLLRGLCC